MQTKNILLVCPDRRIVVDLKPLLSKQLPLTPIEEVDQYPSRKQLSELVSSKTPSLCFLDMASNRDYGLSTLNDLANLSPGTQIVAILAGNDPDLILTCLRQGATEFLLQPLSGEQLHPVLERLSQLGPARGEGGAAKVVVVVPVKGACGASTVAMNLAYAVKRAGHKRILLADLDPSAGTISFLLKLKSTYTFFDALTRSETLDSDLWKGLVSSRDGIDILLAPENPIDTSADLPDPGAVIDFCRQVYETIVLDVGSPFQAWAIQVAKRSDDIFLVTTNELPALRATQRVIANFERQGLERNRLRLVVNRYSTEIGLNQEAIETALHIDVHQVLPSDYEGVQRALVEGKPVPLNTPFGKAMAQLADRSTGSKPPKPENKKNSGWTSLFTSLVSRANS